MANLFSPTSSEEGIFSDEQATTPKVRTMRIENFIFIINQEIFDRVLCTLQNR
ncbi:MAG: hypothetical protein HRT72_12255 [Flavobacteriales bacterium]|nr:hypothetical protein [Flavobacteriales bacterium]